MLVFSLNLFSQDYKTYESQKFENNTLTIKSGNGDYKISAITNSILKISYSNKKFYSDRFYAPVIKTTQKSKNTDNKKNTSVSTEQISAFVNKSDLSIRYYNRKNKCILSEERGMSIKNDTIEYRFYLKPNEKIYGTGARSISLDKRGHKFQCYNQANYGYGMNTDFLNYSIPHIISSENYMILFDNPARAWFDIGKTDKDVMSFKTVGGNLVYYVITGDNYKDLINKYTEFTGRQPLPPIWALGHLQSRFGYRNQKEATDILNKMSDAGYPVDAIILDLYWFGEELQNGLMGNLAWDKKNWPNPKKMIKEFSKKGVKTITVSEPFFTRRCKNFKYLDKKGLLAKNSKGETQTMPNFYFGDAGLIDIFNPKAKDWLWKQYKKQKKIGISGWWGDLGEPEVHPDTLIHHNGKAVEVHGAYGHEWVKMLYNKYSTEYPGERLFKLGRAGFAGSQRFGLIPWSGDVGRSWSGLEAQLPVMLGTGLSGLAYMHSDAGGFAGGTKNPELYTRWIQFAVFTPIFRPHSDPNAEPEAVFYDEKTQKIVKRYIELRYRMLPYNYTLAWEASTKGTPLARPLFLEFDKIINADRYDSYMWGENILVAPIVKQGIKTKSIYLPDGVWFNLWNNSIYNGNNFINQEISIDNIPVYVKAGSFIPYADLVKSTDYYNTKNLEIHYYHHKSVNSGNYKMYCDDGKTKDSNLRNKFQIINFNSDYNKNSLKIRSFLSETSFKNAPEERKIDLVIHNITKSPENVTVNNSAIKYQWNKNENTLKIIFSLKKATNININF